MVVQHGGGFIQYLDGKTMVTHIIASNLTPKKKEEFKRYRIVKPAWIVDSVNAGKLLPWDAYRVVDEGVGQKVLGAAKGSMISQASRKPEGYREQTDTSWYTSQLKAKAPQVAKVTQTITPSEEIEDDEYPMPEITSSIEKVLEDAERVDVPNGADDLQPPSPAPRNLLEVRTELETPPPSSPVDAAESDEQAQGDSEEPEAKETGRRRVREWSQEADYSMAVIRNSEKVRSVSPSKFAQMTAEEHNALLLSDPKIRKSTVVHPDFLEQYYRESRLHHLSTWKADLKSQLQALAAEKSSQQKGKLKKLPGQRRYIMHVDFDSFFAAVSLKKHPQFQDLPCVVAHGNGSGSEIASCNYPARKYGIANGMWMKRAQDLCPELKILPYDFPGYEAASRKFYDAIMATGGIVQSVSIDEALVDISAACFAEAGGSDGVHRHEGTVHREQAKADLIAQKLRDEVFEKTECAVSVGIGGNILLAKVALRKAKPAGQYQLKPEDVLDFIGQLEVTKLPGVAWSLGGKLEEIGIKLVKDIRETSKEKLINTLGPKTGEKMWEYARGIDRTEVGDQVVRKSVSAEVNWGVRFENQDQVDEFMHGLCGELHKRLVKERVKGKQLTMKVMRRAADAPLDPPKHLGHGKCDTYNKSMQLGVATNDTAVIAKEAIAMLKSFNISPGELRGIGVQMQKLDPIKPGPDGVAAESSQRRLQFKAPEARGPRKPSALATEESIEDDARTPEKQRVKDVAQHAIGVPAFAPSTPSKRPLNTAGTQFVMPTQVDPSVLAELPEDIRAKLAKHIKPSEPEAPAKHEDAIESTSKPSSRAQSPMVALPTHSQLDPSILEALPDDVRNEVLGFYKSPSKRGGQAILPQSPRKVRTVPPAATQPVKRKRGGGLFSGRGRGKAIVNCDGGHTLTQANFVSRPDSGSREGTPGTELDPEFLAALPEDIRAEVLAQQRQSALQRKGGIDTSLHQRPKALKRKGKDTGPIERLLHLPPRPATPTFTSRKLSSLEDLRGAMKAWYDEFKDEGPYGEDVEALVKYLRSVVSGEGERDLGKAVGVVKWLGWVVGQDEDGDGEAREKWMDALEKVRGGVQEAATERGLGKVEFG